MYQSEESEIRLENGTVQFSMSSEIIVESSSSQSTNSTSQSTRGSGSLLRGTKATLKTERRRVVCRDMSGRTRVSFKARMQVWLNKDIYIYENSRTCRRHLLNGMFHQDALAKIKSSRSYVKLSKEKIVDWILKVSTRAKQSRQLFNFDEASNYIILLGHTKAEFDSIFALCKGQLKRSRNRSPRNALAMFMMKIVRNFIQERLAFFFGIKNRARVSDVIHRVRKTLEKTLVPDKLGYNRSHMTRDEAITQHNLPFTSKVLSVSDSAVQVVSDGTYCYIQKPSDIERQLDTYCSFKKINLVKMMMTCFLDGYILAADGPFKSNFDNNDATILNGLLLQSDFLGGFLQDDDVLLLDRGFRHSITKANKMGFHTFMPRLLQISKNQMQFTTSDANHSRKVTLLRFVVEAVNGSSASFKGLFQLPTFQQ